MLDDLAVFAFCMMICEIESDLEWLSFYRVSI